MCGGYSITKNVKKAALKLGSDFEGPFIPRFNARPSQNLPVLLNSTPKKVIPANWGITPSWANDKKSPMINVRLESADKPVFRKDFSERRCLVFADGFYEWEKTKSGKQPHYFFMKDSEIFTIAGVWEENDQKQPCFAILTMPPNNLVAKFHDRMPMILSHEKAIKWLSPKTTVHEFIGQLKLYPSAEMDEHMVSREVNVAHNDFPELIEKKTA